MEEWVDISRLESNMEEQINRDGRTVRYRPRLIDEETGIQIEYPWIYKNANLRSSIYPI